jgi:hypothetical protein
VLRAHLRSAQQAAQQLLSDAERTPPRGWEPADFEQTQRQAGQMHSLVELVRSIRELLPEDVLAEFTDLIRALLNVLRALVDVLLSRSSSGAQERDAEIKDIPIF